MKDHTFKAFLRSIFILSCILMILTSCSFSHSTSRQKSEGNGISLTPKIIFLNYSIRKDQSNRTVEIRLINKIIAEGTLKEKFTNNEPPKNGDLKVITLDERMNPIETTILSDPLNVTVEAVDENNGLFKKEIIRDSAEFSIRLQLSEKLYAVGIKGYTTELNNNSYLLVTKLRQP